MTRHGHGTGWQPKRAAAAHNEMIATRRYATVAPNRRATRPDSSRTGTERTMCHR